MKILSVVLLITAYCYVGHKVYLEAGPWTVGFIAFSYGLTIVNMYITKQGMGAIQDFAVATVEKLKELKGVLDTR